LADHDETLEQVVRTLREPVRIDPDVDRRVMAAIAQLPPLASTSHVRSMRTWLQHSWTVRLNPLGGLAAAAALATLIIAGSRLLGPRTFDTPPVAEITQAALTQFVLVAPNAASVSVVGDFNDWNFQATPLARQAGDGVWWVNLPLQPGRYRYAFVVNGTRWQGDPNAPSAEDEFGRPNSVVTIGG
jgi:hypothetical protein